MEKNVLTLTLIFQLLFFLTFCGINDIWKSCCESGCNYTIGQSVTIGEKTFYCCQGGWSSIPCGTPPQPPSSCDSATGAFSNRCPQENTQIPLTCENNKVCIYKIEKIFTCDNTNKQSNTITSGYYCIDKKPPYYVDIYHKPEIISTKDDTYDPYPNYFIDWKGSSITLNPDKLVIDKEYVEFTIKSRDEYNNQEISGVYSSYASFSGKSSSASFAVNNCPNGAAYSPPATHVARFTRDLNIGWNTLSTTITDQSRNSASNSNYQLYIFLGARGDEQNQYGTDKIVFLKTYWDSSSEVKSKTSYYGGNYFKRINCFSYSNKCTQIRDIVGKTDEFTDCLWVGPSSTPRNVRIYNFKEGVYLEGNTKLDYKTCSNANYCNTKQDAPIFVYPGVNEQIAFCSKNDTGILIDLPNLVSDNVPDGFQILPSTKERFSVIWQVKYAREQREVAVECYLNPTIDGSNACTIDDIISGRCDIKTGQQCKCSEGFPCKQDTSFKTIHSCTVENPRYFVGINRIICKYYDPRDLGIRAEVWYNHDFYFDGRKVYIDTLESLVKLMFKPIEILKFIFKL
jgi:hypothetical protein